MEHGTEDIIDAPGSTLATRSEGAMVGPGGPAIGSLIELAIHEKVSPDSLEKLVTLHERLSDRAAAEEFARAMASFQRECPQIRKESKAEIPTKSGGKYTFRFASLEAIWRTVRPILEKNNLTVTWDSKEDKGLVSCTCIVKHVNGHSERASFSCTTDTSASMIGPQKSAAAVTFARRQSLVQALGLTTTDQDTDGGPPTVTVPITEHQAANLQALIDETKTDLKKFLAWVGVEKLSDVPSSRFPDAIKFLERKRNAS